MRPGTVDGLFETVLVRGGVPVRLEEHLDRLAGSARTLDLPAPDLVKIAREARSLCIRLGIDDGRLWVGLDRGRARVTLEPFPGHPAEAYERGAVVEIADRPGHPLGAAAGHKVVPYPLHDVRAEAFGRGVFEVIHRDEDGALLEGCISNLFVVIDGVLTTPPLSRPILPGTTRQAVLDLARAEGIEAREADLRIEDLDGVSEAFLTASLMEVVPIRRLGGIELAPGPVAELLLARLRGGD